MERVSCDGQDELLSPLSAARFLFLLRTNLMSWAVPVFLGDVDASGCTA